MALVLLPGTGSVSSVSFLHPATIAANITIKTDKK
jgi:hypothetical protein